MDPHASLMPKCNTIPTHGSDAEDTSATLGADWPTPGKYFGATYARDWIGRALLPACYRPCAMHCTGHAEIDLNSKASCSRHHTNQGKDNRFSFIINCDNHWWWLCQSTRTKLHLNASALEGALRLCASLFFFDDDHLDLVLSGILFLLFLTIALVLLIILVTNSL